MNKTMLYSGILSILSTAACAQATIKATGIPGKSPVTIAANTTTPAAATVSTTPVTPTAIVVPPTDNAVKPATTNVTPGTTTVVTPLDAKNATSTTVTPVAANPVDCSYKTPPQNTHIDQSIVTQWAEKATQQSFDFENESIDKQLAALKACFTDQGWQSFNDALLKSGNLNAIKSQKLAVSSMVNGKSTSSEIKENQWKISIPLQVVYQNDKEKLTQLLTVDLIVGRKITSGDLGIMQMIASPLKADSPVVKAPLTTTPTTVTH